MNWNIQELIESANHGISKEDLMAGLSQIQPKIEQMPKVQKI